MNETLMWGIGGGGTFLITLITFFLALSSRISENTNAARAAEERARIADIAAANALSKQDSLLRELNESKIAMAAKISTLETKVDTMWAFQMRRAASEAVSLGIGKMESPLTLNDDAIKTLDPIRGELESFGKTMISNGCGDAQVLLEIEKQFGDKLLSDTCIPMRMSHGACLLLAYAIAMQKSEIDLSKLQSH
jgi:hypothetical protein